MNRASRAEALAAEYRHEYGATGELTELLRRLREPMGAPETCHGDVLAQLANQWD